MQREFELPRWVYETVDDICAESGINSIALVAPRPRLAGHIADIRNFAVYAVRRIGNGSPSFPALGRMFGKNHSTLVAGDRKFRARLKTDRRLAERVNEYLTNSQKDDTCRTGEASDLTHDISPRTNSTERK